MARYRSSFELREGTAAEWASKNPILKSSEPGREKDTGRIKYGDGSSYWNDLPYFGEGSSSEALQNHIDSETPHPIYDDGPSLALLYENAKV